MIDVQNLTRQFRKHRVLDEVTFTVQPGLVTGFLGPNGAGKSTAMRLMVGLDTPTSGRVLVAGTAYRDLSAPLRVVGALLDASAFHPGRSARQHLAYLAASNRLPNSRIETVLASTGLTDVARRRVGSYSLGMKQRLGIAAALLGDPAALILDEPNNGLDPDGIIWLRGLLAALAAEGRAVLVSSHLISELALGADRLVVIARGRVLADVPTEQLAGAGAQSLEDAYLELTRGLTEFTSPQHDGSQE